MMQLIKRRMSDLQLILITIDKTFWCKEGNQSLKFSKKVHLTDDNRKMLIDVYETWTKYKNGIKKVVLNYFEDIFQAGTTDLEAHIRFSE